jgi:hypothetical protein
MLSNEFFIIRYGILKNVATICICIIIFIIDFVNETNEALWGNISYLDSGMDTISIKTSGGLNASRKFINFIRCKINHSKKTAKILRIDPYQFLSCNCKVQL